MKSQNEDICFRCNQHKEYGTWVTSKKKYEYFCKDCYQKKIEEEDDKNGEKVDSKGL